MSMADVSVPGSGAVPASRAGRVHWIDIAKGIGIILVVFGHALRGLLTRDMLAVDPWAHVDFILYTFHMPLFMYLAGMNVLGSLDKPNFLRKKAVSIAWPYVLWGTVMGVMMIVVNDIRRDGELWWERLLHLVYWPHSQFWFLWVLFAFMVLAYFWRPSRLMLGVALVLLCISPLLDTTEIDPRATNLPFQFSYFLFFFVLGAVMPVRNTPLALCLGGGLVFAIGLTLAYTVPAAQDFNYYAPALLPVALAGGALVLGLSQVIAQSRWLELLGRASLAIYVLHIVFTAGSRMVLLRAGIDDPLVLLGLSSLVGVVAPLCAFLVARRLGLLRVLGLGG